MFTLCIPTIDRFDKFLSRYLPEYINNSLINEIIITDENGNDIDKIDSTNQTVNALPLISRGVLINTKISRSNHIVG